jgi:hypothetical protein
MNQLFSKYFSSLKLSEKLTLFKSFISTKYMILISDALELLPVKNQEAVNALKVSRTVLNLETPKNRWISKREPKHLVLLKKLLSAKCENRLSKLSW